MGSGNSELRFLFRRGSLKKVVCVWTVCVVVVVLPYICPSPELPSDREDSEIRGSDAWETGTARAELECSPYEGGALCWSWRCIVESLCRSSRPLVFPRRHRNEEPFFADRAMSVEGLRSCSDARDLVVGFLNTDGRSCLSRPCCCTSGSAAPMVGAVLTITGSTPSAVTAGMGGSASPALSLSLSASNFARDHRCGSEWLRNFIRLKRERDCPGFSR